jgi:hypothetical protein
MADGEEGHAAAPFDGAELPAKPVNVNLKFRLEAAFAQAFEPLTDFRTLCFNQGEDAFPSFKLIFDAIDRSSELHPELKYEGYIRADLFLGQHPRHLANSQRELRAIVVSFHCVPEVSIALVWTPAADAEGEPARANPEGLGDSAPGGVVWFGLARLIVPIG